VPMATIDGWLDGGMDGYYGTNKLRKRN